MKVKEEQYYIAGFDPSGLKSNRETTDFQPKFGIGDAINRSNVSMQDMLTDIVCKVFCVLMQTSNQILRGVVWWYHRMVYRPRYYARALQLFR